MYEAQLVVALAGDVLQVERLVAKPGLGARVSPVVSGQHLDQGRLAGAVLSHQGVDLAVCDIQRHAIQGLRTRERLGEVDQAQDGADMRICRHRLGDRRVHAHAWPLAVLGVRWINNLVPPCRSVATHRAPY